MDSPTLRAAVPEDADRLTTIALRSKAYWGYPAEFIQACRAELSVDRGRITSDAFNFVVAEVGGDIVAFFGIEHLSSTRFELVALFVDPPYVGKGVGRHLMECALHRVSELGGTNLVIQGDPNAEDFYLSAGGKKTGVRESGSIPGRYLPVFEIDLREGNEIASLRSQ